MFSAPRRMLAVATTAVATLITGSALAPTYREQDPEPTDYRRDVEPLLAKYCFKCHGDKKQKGDMQLNRLDPEMTAQADAEGWHAALDVINAGEMPPEDEAQPSDAERRLVVRWLTESLARAADRQKGERAVVLRRLTREQYTNSLQDLLGVPIEFGETLPEDGKAKNGFSNNGEVLQASPLHLDNYQKIARLGLDQAIAGEKPAVTHYRVTFGKGRGKGKVAGRTGGYQSVPLNPEDFTVDVLRDDRPVDGGTDEERKARERVQRKISVGLRGSGQDRFRAVDEGMILLSALPHREKVPQAWQGPSPNLKLEMQRVWPEQGDFVMRVKASRGYLPPMRKQLLVNVDDAAPAARWEKNRLVVPDGAIVVAAEESDQRKNLELDGDFLRPKEVPKDSKARVRVELPADGFYQVDLVHPPVSPDAMPSVRLRAAGHHLDQRPELTPEQLQQPRLTTALGVVGMRKGGHHMEVGGKFFVGFSHVVVTPLDASHPQVQRLSKVGRAQEEAVAALTPSIRALIGTRTDDGMDYTTFDDAQDVTAPLGAAETYEFFGRLENLPIPEPESGDKEILSGFLLLGVWNDHLVKSKQETGPPLMVESIEFEAPYLPTWPPASHTDIFFDSDTRSNDEPYTREVLRRFVARAFRRPARDEEVERYLGFWRDVRGDHEVYEDSVKEVLVAVLCSPEFLYLCEPLDELADDRALPDWMLANRLSYFLWNGPPDEELRELAANGRLKDQLLEQTDRMLDDPRRRRFLQRFAYEWLRMDRHDAMTINVDLHRDYTRFVKRDMREETFAFFELVFGEDLPLSTFVAADFAMLNQNLAEFYGVEGVYGAHFRKVPVPASMPERGCGLLSQGSFHVGHSDGNEPHPIKRAVWLKARLLGDEPPPPPPNVPDLDPDTPGAAKMTLKQRIESHRDKDSCRDCHAGIDPYGFVFERMSAVGRFEPKRKGVAIDATSTLPDGAEVDGLPGIRAYLAADGKDAFARSLLEHMFAYALGRETGFADEAELDALLEKVQVSGYRARAVVRGIVTSPSFLSK
jgi:mono/diheme cytochrome c family protein